MLKYRDLAQSMPHNALNKWSHYPEIYDEVFGRLRDCRAALEIGIQNGGSLQMLAALFSTAAIHGLDVNPACAALRGTLGDRIAITIGDATDLNTLASLPEFDVIIDDGSHVPHMQAVAFSYLFQHKLSANGVYLVEDLEHSFYDWWRDQPWFALDSFFDHVQHRIDEMHYVYTDPDKAERTYCSLRLRKIEIYRGICVFYKSEPLEVPRNLWWDGKRVIG